MELPTMVEIDLNILLVAGAGNTKPFVETIASLADFSNPHNENKLQRQTSYELIESDFSDTNISHAIPLHTYSSQADSSQIYSSQADSSQTDSSQTDSSQTDSSQTDSSQANSSQANSSQANSSQANSSQANSSQADSSQIDSLNIISSHPTSSHSPFHALLKSYVLKISDQHNYSIQFITTPNVTNQDDTDNFEASLQKIQQIMPALHGVCIILESQQNDNLEYCIGLLLKMFDQKFVEKVLFVIPKGNIDIQRDLERIFKEIIESPPHVNFHLKPENTYFIAERMSVENNKKEFKRLIHFLLLNKSCFAIELLMEALCDVTQLIQENKLLLRDHKEKFQKVEHFLQETNKTGLPSINLKLLDLQGPATICTNDRCCTKVTFGKREMLEYLRICHCPCYKEYKAPELSHCSVMNPVQAKCFHCSCDSGLHVQVHYLTKRFSEDLPDFTASSDIDQMCSEKAKHETYLKLIDDQLKKYDKEHSIIVKACAKLVSFWHKKGWQNSLTGQESTEERDDKFRSTLEFYVEREGTKGPFKSKDYWFMLRNYDKALDKETRDRKSEIGEGIEHKYIQDIQETIKGLFELEPHGSLLKKLYDAELSGRALLQRSKGENVCNSESVGVVNSEIIKSVLGEKKDESKLKIKVVLSQRFYDTGDDCYNTRSNFRGKVLLINNINFDYQEKRCGAEIDEANLLELFQQMGNWEVVPHRDLTGDGIKNKIEDFKKASCSQKYDINVVIVMSHGMGELTEVVGKDDALVETKYIIHAFNNVNCEFLRGIPKVFIFVCCRGKKNDKGVQVKDDSTTSTIASVSDMLIVYSTVPGYLSKRDPDSGTWFVQALCEEFMNRAYDTNIERLLRDVSKNVAKRTSPEGDKQSSEVINWTFDTCYLHPGLRICN